jgi:hypothetical protein
MTGTAAIVYMNTTAANSDTDWTYREEGVDGNAVGIEFLDPGVASAALSMSYLNGKVSVNLATDGASAISTTGNLLIAAVNGVKAVNTLTSADTGTWTTGCTVVIGGQTYTGRTTLSSAPTIPYEFLCATNGDTCIDNLVSAINGAGTIGTDYSLGTLPNPSVVALRASHTMTATAKWGGTAYNTIATTQPSADVKITGWAATTLGGAAATVIGVDSLWPAIGKIFQVSKHSGHDGTGLVDALSVKTALSASGTPGVGVTYDSVTTMRAAGWKIHGTITSGAVITQNDKARVAADGGQLTDYRASVFNADTGGEILISADSAAHLLAAAKMYAIQMANHGKARHWNPSSYNAPTLFATR